MNDSPDEREPSAATEARVAMAHRTAVIIVLALTATVVLYVGIGLLILQRASVRTTGSDLRLPLYGVGGGFRAGFNRIAPRATFGIQTGVDRRAARSRGSAQTSIHGYADIGCARGGGRNDGAVDSVFRGRRGRLDSSWDCRADRFAVQLSAAWNVAASRRVFYGGWSKAA